MTSPSTTIGVPRQITSSSTPTTTSGRAVWLMLSVACGVKESVSALHLAAGRDAVLQLGQLSADLRGHRLERAAVPGLRSCP